MSQSYSPEDLLRENRVSSIPQFTRMMVDGVERTLCEITPDGLMFSGGILVLWEQKRLQDITHYGDGEKMLARPASLPVVIVSEALGIDRRHLVSAGC